MSFKRNKWKNIGKTPDYRFSLANERTFLAWIRTALALLAGAIAIEQLLHEAAAPWLRTLLAVFLASAGGLPPLWLFIAGDKTKSLCAKRSRYNTPPFLLWWRYSLPSLPSFHSSTFCYRHYHAWSWFTAGKNTTSLEPYFAPVSNQWVIVLTTRANTVVMASVIRSCHCDRPTVLN